MSRDRLSDSLKFSNNLVVFQLKGHGLLGAVGGLVLEHVIQTQGYDQWNTVVIRYARQPQRIPEIVTVSTKESEIHTFRFIFHNCMSDE